MFRWKGLFIIGATATVTYCEEGRGRKKKQSGAESPGETSCLLHTLDFICQFGSGVGTGRASGNWRHKLKGIDNAAAALQNTVAEHCCCLQSK